MASHMQRTLNEIKKNKLRYWIVERWCPHTRRRIDLFNIIDLLVLDQDIIGVQVCGADFSAHVNKLRNDEAESTMAWLESGGRLQIWGWRKVKVKRGGKQMVWKPRIADVLLVQNEIYVEESCNSK